MDILEREFTEFFKDNIMPPLFKNVNIDEYLCKELLPSILNYLKNKKDKKINPFESFVYYWCDFCGGIGNVYVTQNQEYFFEEKSDLLINKVIDILNNLTIDEVKKNELLREIKKN